MTEFGELGVLLQIKWLAVSEYRDYSAYRWEWIRSLSFQDH